VATAQALDEEMRERVLRHQQDRGADFVTIEEPLEIGRAIGAQRSSLDVLVVDCLTLWISNLLLAGREPDVEDLLQPNPLVLILVTNEVGCGVVPENALARRFRDLAGDINQRVAAQSDEVYWMVFGTPVRVK
jgi:adenosylcobinamide kinase/adenosylcobinamide-phosphate guanylyltransferase